MGRNQTTHTSNDGDSDRFRLRGLSTPPVNQPGEGGPSPTGIDPRYQVEGILGTGGRHVVYDAEDLTLDRQVAMKLVNGAADGRGIAGVVAEARLTARLEHAHILPVFDLGFTPDGRAYFTMRKARGMSLGEALERLARGEQIPEVATIERRLEVFLKACDAVAYAHHEGVVHRDLKPDNILLGGFGEVVVVDWGAARLLSEPHEDQGRVVGTPAFCAPEQARGEAADERSDVWCLGATLFQMVYGRLPMWEDDREAFWQHKRTGEIQPPNEHERTQAGAELEAVILAALAPDARDRYASVAMFQESVRGWQSRRASGSCCDQAERELATAASARGYDGFLAAQLAFRQALALWPHNPRATAGIRRAHHLHAATALTRGDLDLADGLIDPTDPAHHDLAAALAAARGQRLGTARRAWLYRSLALLLMLAALALSGLLAYEYWQRFGRWQTVLAVDFDHPGSRLEVESANLVATGMLQSRLYTIVGTPDGAVLPPYSIHWLSEVSVPGDVRVDLEISWPGQIDGFEIHINSKASPLAGFATAPRGYTCQFAGWLGHWTVIGIQQKDSSLGQGHALAQTVKGQGRHRLVFERQGDVLSASIDGRPAFERRILVPVAGWAQRQVALRSWSEVRVHKLTVERLTGPQRASVLVVGDHIRANGDAPEAIGTWLTAASDHPGTALAEQALARAALTAIDLGPAWSASAAAIRTRLATDHPTSPLLSDLELADTVMTWRSGHTEAALDQAEAILNRQPDARIVPLLLNEEHRPLSDQDGRRLLLLAARSSGISRLDLSGFDLTDLTPLRGMPLTSLMLIGNRRLTDLTPLQGMRLATLNLDHCIALHDLSPLRGIPLNSLTCNNTKVADLSFLRGSVTLQRLVARSTQVADLAPLAGCPLSQLDVGHTRVSNLSPLRGARLTQLSIDGTEVADLSPCAGMPLSRLQLHLCRVVDLSPLRGAPLESLGVVGLIGLTDLSPLASSPLSRGVILDNSGVRDLAPLAGKHLDLLSLRGTPVSDLSPLAGADIKVLLIDDTRISDLTPLAGQGLVDLSAAGTLVADLTPLAGSPLRSLNIYGSAVRSLAPLAHRRPELVDAGGLGAVELGSWSATPPEVLLIDQAHQPATWRALPGTTLMRRIAMVRQAYLTANESALRALAMDIAGRPMLLVELPQTIREARARASRVGAHLARPDSMAVVRQLRQLWLTQCSRAVTLAWVGMSTHTTWDDGTPLISRLIGPQLVVPVAGWALSQGQHQQDLVPMPMIGDDSQVIAATLLEWPQP